MPIFNGIITKIEVKDNARTASIETSPTDTFKVTNDNESSFEAMMSVLSLARVVSIPVTIEHVLDKEIDKLTL